MQPGRELGLAPEGAQPLEGADEGVLRELPGEIVVTREPVGQPVHAIHVRIVQCTLCGAVPGADSGYQFAFVHRAPGAAISVNPLTLER